MRKFFKIFYKKLRKFLHTSPSFTFQLTTSPVVDHLQNRAETPGRTAAAIRTAVSSRSRRKPTAAKTDHPLTRNSIIKPTKLTAIEGRKPEILKLSLRLKRLLLRPCPRRRCRRPRLPPPPRPPHPSRRRLSRATPRIRRAKLATVARRKKSVSWRREGRVKKTIQDLNVTVRGVSLRRGRSIRVPRENRIRRVVSPNSWIREGQALGGNDRDRRAIADDPRVTIEAAERHPGVSIRSRPGIRIRNGDAGAVHRTRKAPTTNDVRVSRVFEGCVSETENWS